ncbi:MAG: hypothetical protein ACXWTY_17950 [Methylobacter sp.]
MKHTSMRFTGFWEGIFLTFVPVGDPDVGADVGWSGMLNVGQNGSPLQLIILIVS